MINVACWLFIVMAVGTPMHRGPSELFVEVKIEAEKR